MVSARGTVGITLLLGVRKLLPAMDGFEDVE